MIFDCFKLQDLFLRKTSPSRRLMDSQEKSKDEYDYWIGRLRDKFSNEYMLELNSVQFTENYVPKVEEIRLIQTENKSNPHIFYSTGAQSILGYLAELEENGYAPTSLNTVLEFGVGYGRLLRHFVPFKASLYGCDVTEKTIHWCNSNLAGFAKFEITDFAPPLPYENNMFDFIFANSVFTHIQYSDTIPWVDELHRISKPGGCVITSHYDINEHLQAFDSISLDRELKDKGYIEWGDVSVRENNIYFTQKKLKEIWGTKFDILDYRNYHKDQAHLIMRRKDEYSIGNIAFGS